MNTPTTRTRRRRARLRALWRHTHPLLCWVCVYLGVLTTMLLPTTALLSQFWPMSGIALAVTPYVGIWITCRVVDRRALARWMAAEHEPLTVRMLRALGDGAACAEHVGLPLPMRKEV